MQSATYVRGQSVGHPDSRAAPRLVARSQPPQQTPDAEFRFKSGVELINVTATVSDDTGRFVPGLRQDDFAVYEDDRPQAVSHFSAERVPVSLGIALDTSGSMAGERIRGARRALDRFLYDLLDAEDELFLYHFDDRPALVQGWTTDRQLLSRALGRVVADGTTAMYDAVVQAIRLTATGQHRKKALVVLSDGHDTASYAKLRDVKELIRESEAMLYAIGIECGIGRRPALAAASTIAAPRADPVSFPSGRPPRLADPAAAAADAHAAAARSQVEPRAAPNRST